MKVIGLYDWSGNNSIFPELWLVPHFLPFHPGILFLATKNKSRFSIFHVNVPLAIVVIRYCIFVGILEIHLVVARFVLDSAKSVLHLQNLPFLNHVFVVITHLFSCHELSSKVTKSYFLHALSKCSESVNHPAQAGSTWTSLPFSTANNIHREIVITLVKHGKS
jgi:hypothetical protein